ncbi:MAG: signal recognition particle-docking protein FtsY [Lachnospiraceae bacterium]|nr:signal recognition particle-docking protein FtsY [Lachnospiraceae bacterium]MDN4743178.1 signal recognition particle-docking protein FtsY [Lachnospiraceae bacterium C1.1]
MGFFSKLADFFTGYKEIDEDFYEELEETLIMGDLGINTTEAILEDLRKKVREKRISEPSECRELLKEIMKEMLKSVRTDDMYDFENNKSVVLVVGVNGVGKTTTVGKLAANYKNEGKKVLLSAADTFRAAAIEQLDVWAERAGVDIINGKEGGDPGSVIFDSIQAAKARNTDILICDTAGRLHNKKNLMNELKKINTIIEGGYSEAIKETLVVVDGTTGQNAMSQAKEFLEVTNVTGLVLTKLDGSAKGGIAVSIQNELGIPVKYIGLGEKISDLEKFDPDKFVEGLFDNEQ